MKFIAVTNYQVHRCV